MRLELDGYGRERLTPKNIALIRQVLTPGVWGRVLNLPIAMMAEAQRQQHDPIRAAVTAQLGVAIAILAGYASAWALAAACVSARSRPAVSACLL
jgi:hypothetical protein